LKRGFRPRPFFWIALTAFILAGGLIAGTMFGPVSGSRRSVDVTIPRGASIARIGQILERRHLVNNAVAFRLLARMSGDPKIDAGTYRLSPAMSPGRILRELEWGANARMVRVTVPEGFTLEQITERSATVPGVTADAFRDLATRRGLTFNAAFGPPPNLEGYLFPDTYDFPRTTTDRDIVQAMLDNFDHKVAKPLDADFRASAKRGFPLDKIVTIASLIEREAKVPGDRPLIAGVIYNRLKRAMPLQIDATVQYVVGHKEKLTYEDLQVESPYNTYKVTGLPPGPICNPGLPAIRAALHPADVSYLYYTANPDGTHTFTNTLKQHVRATTAARRRMRSLGG
jgi:UPF0755 protein